MQSEIYKKQNAGLKRLALELVKILKTDSVGDRVGEVIDILASINAKFNEHLMTETYLILFEVFPENELRSADFGFYKRSSRNDLKNQIRKYVTSWSLPSKILEEPKSFIDDSNVLMDSLLLRLQNETEFLFPMLEGSLLVSSENI
ncbi:hypothetical protein EHQ12_07610 [Leptospira gomenensis]|uniref:Hemerythrin domain-containing protein n=1 Tax=Leptospira gomenensis TaxID=2484974 RepID=A0A5F1YB58_9LEPT|nr:hypothetical protein [Leptospira gomenensis]TGK34550.1 hypothetical protein EHQ17_09005 [Leptospira gomenensis]TGK40140.1 hypothetical protein EHQ07_18895 [Leptospira gomenensis]TGK40449.1 hypothetical protein EHQ12_07610 [Leptospira gomenensis]TGK55649.1 hypothetical protein EHQ13_17120 [Leptospira gomenensis]